jgi:hypothetical protein
MPSSRRTPIVALGVAFAAAATAAAAPPAPAPQRPVAAPLAVETIERVAAVVDDRPLLLSDVRALEIVRGLAADRALEAAIDERLMFSEAARLAQAEVRPGDEDEALAALVQREPQVARRVAEPDLRRLLRRQLTILRYVEFRFRPQVRVSDEQVRKAWETEEVGRPSGTALEDAQDAIRARLERRALDERVEAWVAELRARAEARVVSP